MIPVSQSSSLAIQKFRPMKTHLLIDGYAMMFRSFYAVRFAPVYKNVTVNAVYGCATTIMQSLEHFEPDSVVVCLDAPQKTFRHEADENYKAQRTKAPDEFISQIPLVQALIESFGIPMYIKPGFEADDIIGTLAKRAEAQGDKTYILSGDYDFLQLTTELTQLAKFNGQTPLVFDRDMTIDKLGVTPEQVIDYKAICGDSSDNYKGVPGVGPKGASTLLAEYGTLEGIYENLDQLSEKQRLKFSENKDQAFHCQHMATIHLDVPVEHDFADYTLPFEAVRDFYIELGFPSLIRRLEKVSGTKPAPKKPVQDDQQASLF